MKFGEDAVKSARNPVTGDFFKDPSGKKVRVQVGVARYPIYETLDEAIHHEGKEKVLKLFNTQLATNTANAIRASAVQPVNREKIKADLMSMDSNSGLWQDAEFLALVGDKVRMVAFIEKKVDEVIAERTKALQAQSEATGSTENEDDDEA